MNYFQASILRQNWCVDELGDLGAIETLLASKRNSLFCSSSEATIFIIGLVHVFNVCLMIACLLLIRLSIRGTD